MLNFDHKQLVSKLAVLFTEALFPIECLGCRLSGAQLCQSCCQQITYQAEQLCHFCKLPSVLGATCFACRLIHALDGVLVMAHYQGLLKEAISLYKYQFVYSLATELSSLLTTFFSVQAWPYPQALIIPMPLSVKRARWRSFNQAALLAKPLARSTEMSYDDQSLIRSIHSTAQAKLNQAERLALSAQTFTWRGESLAGRSVLLIDDVISTGRSLSVAAEVLKAVGAEQVWGLVLARGN
jgi:ComF family protein